MEQKVTKKTKKQLWSLYVFIRTGERTFRKYLYLNVIQFYQEEGLLHIIVDKDEKHIHDLSRVESIQVREHDRSGRIQ